MYYLLWDYACHAHTLMQTFVNMFEYAIESSCKRAYTLSLKDIVSSGMEVVVGMFYVLIPIVVAWGTVALIVATYTPVFNWISYPMGVFLNVLGVEEAFAVAPATLIGFTDMFIPALLVGGIQSVKTKFIIAALSLVQIISARLARIIPQTALILPIWDIILWLKLLSP